MISGDFAGAEAVSERAEAVSERAEAVSERAEAVSERARTCQAMSYALAGTLRTVFIRIFNPALL